VPDKNTSDHTPLPGGKGSPDQQQRSAVLSLLVVAAIVVYLLFTMEGNLFPSASTPDVLATNEFVSAVEAGQVTSVTYKTDDGSVSGTYEVDDDAHNYKSVYVGSDSLAALMASHPDVTYRIDTSSSAMLETILLSVVPTVLLVGVFIFYMRRMSSQNDKTMSFAKTKALTTERERPKVKFSDVAGIDEAVEELQEVRDFLSDPERYHKMGARIPHGVLLVGPPGTGKTLLAKAVAGEAGVPFYSISGSDFVEMFVGVGASRVRDLFKQAKESAPCIIFIDEIDAVGKRRDGSLNSNDEREQTLNQLLSEMDGFDNHKGIVVLAATNRPESLDQALLRAGRFDRRIPVELPDLAGREAILKIHATDVKMEGSIELGVIARSTPGASGADLANIINEAALRAVRFGRSRVTQEDLVESVDVVIAGEKKKSTVLSPHEKEVVSYHETATPSWRPPRRVVRRSPRSRSCRAPRARSGSPCRSRRTSTS
jgi:cell division protease FtsH